MPLAYLPEPKVLFAWDGTEALAFVSAAASARETETRVMGPEGRARRVSGRALAIGDGVTRLSVLAASQLAPLGPSVVAWALASKLALELVARERVVPTLRARAAAAERGGATHEARWVAALAGVDDATRVATLARALPPSAHAAVTDGDGVFDPDALVRAFLDDAADALLRSVDAAPAPTRLPATSWERRWVDALVASDATRAALELRGFSERTVAEDVQRWSEPVVGASDRWRATFRLELPADGDETFRVRFFLQAPDDPSLLVDASEIWSKKKRVGRVGKALGGKAGRAPRDPQESLLEALARAARVFEPLAASLADACPEQIELDAPGAWRFLHDGAPALADAGFGVLVPGDLTPRGQRRLRLRMRVGGKTTTVAGKVETASALGMASLLDFGWQAAIGDEPISARELAALAKQKAPLVRHRGAWVAVDPDELVEIQRRLTSGAGRMRMADALQAVLAGEVVSGGLDVTVAAEGALAGMLERLRAGAVARITTPTSLRATLRPYQERGVAWLATMGGLGLGACLADDMGLGKTVQLLAFLLLRREQEPRDRRPTLLVAPTSVVGNWERETARFAPDIAIVRHYGAGRARAPEELASEAGALVLTTYGLLRRDAELLRHVPFAVVALDEAQNIKNAASATARAARALVADHRFALTGTPVENRLAELWSILEFANPGLLGSLASFRQTYAVPIERHADEQVAERLRRIAGPFVLRRAKTDPGILKDLPPKNEMKVICSLTREQATLYKAAVDEELKRITSAEGIERRGRVLALLTSLKQICNHPAHFLGEAGPLPRRSGKLARLTAMLDEAMAAGDKALVFTQFREMGDRLVRHLRAGLGVEIAFLHGGTSKKQRDALVEAFQDASRGPRVFVLSLKAGGTGLNLTAASHVFHFDRWWNPAVEDQATDRAYRIGQRRAVQVHKLMCAGTVEEKVDRMLEDKRRLASRVVSAGEQWITELGDAELRDLFALSRDAVVGSDDEATEVAS